MPGPGEALWMPSDRETALAWFAEQDGLCKCGNPLDETTAPDKDERSYIGDTVTCMSCYAAQTAFDARVAGEDVASHRGVLPLRPQLRSEVNRPGE